VNGLAANGEHAAAVWGPSSRHHQKHFLKRPSLVYGVQYLRESDKAACKPKFESPELSSELFADSSTANEA
jgi:hypothetical protein